MDKEYIFLDKMGTNRSADFNKCGIKMLVSTPPVYQVTLIQLIFPRINENLEMLINGCSIKKYVLK